MSTQWYDKIINAIRGVVSCQNYCFILPLILFGVTIAAMFTDLNENENEMLTCVTGKKSCEIICDYKQPLT
jgi:hypothetical protein